LAGAIRYGLPRLKRLRPHLDDGRLSIDNNVGKSAAIAYTLIETAKLNGLDPQAWLTKVLNRIADRHINQGDARDTCKKLS
jgi:transposase